MTPNCKDIIREIILEEILGVDINRIILHTSGTVVYANEEGGDICITIQPLPKPVVS